MTVTQAEQTEAAPFAPVDDEAGAPDRRKLALIGVAAAVVLAAAGYFLIGGGGGGSNTASSLVPSGRHLVKPAAAGNAPAANHPVLPPVSTVKLGRDPFHPLYVVPAAPTGPLPGSTSTGSTGGTGSTGTGTSTGTVTPPSKPVATTYSLRLSRVDGSGSDLTARFLIGSANKIQFARAAPSCRATSCR